MKHTFRYCQYCDRTMSFVKVEGQVHCRKCGHLWKPPVEPPRPSWNSNLAKGIKR